MLLGYGPACGKNSLMANLRQLARVTAAVATLGIAATGCGGGEGDGLAKPVFSNCVPKDFGKPRASRAGGKGSGFWLVYYFHDRRKPQKIGDTTSVSITERPTRYPRGRIRGGREVTVAGRSVSLFGSSRIGYVAQWKTGRATYAAIANGAKPDVLKRFIKCMP